MTDPIVDVPSFWFDSGWSQWAEEHYPEAMNQILHSFAEYVELTGKQIYE